MKPYLHMIGVATPSTGVYNNGPHVLFDNDTIAVLQAASVTHKNPHRSQFRNALNEVVDEFDVAFHAFSYYMGEEVTYEDGFGKHTVSTQIARTDIERHIMNALDAHLKAKSQWKKEKELGYLCEDKRILMKHKWDDSLSKKFGKTEVYEFDEDGKLYFVLRDDFQELTYVRSHSRNGHRIENVDEGDVCLVLKDSSSNIIGSISSSDDNGDNDGGDNDDNSTNPGDGDSGNGDNGGNDNGNDDNNTTDPTQDPNKVCASNFFHYGDGKIIESLKKGDKDEGTHSGGTKHQVQELQEFLEAFGYNVGNSGADGWFGADTEEALILFQDANDLDADGIVGPNTRNAINNTNCYDK
jgi:hypothetical protein